MQSMLDSEEGRQLLKEEKQAVKVGSCSSVTLTCMLSYARGCWELMLMCSQTHREHAFYENRDLCMRAAVL
jgi:hypothetical protein